MTEPRQFPVIVLGTGNIGRAFLAQAQQTRERFAARYGVALNPVALADVSGVVFNADGLTAETIASISANLSEDQLIAQQPGALEFTGMDLMKHITAQGLENAIMVDTTAAETGEMLRYALANDIAVTMANKRPLADPWEDARVIFDSPRARFEASAGAGLPVVGTLRYLVDTGDVVQHIEGALSGTLGYLCSHLEDGEAFSSVVNRAKARGYTEPDPREDLSGMDVARKALILARIAGWPKELEDLQIHALYPTEMAELPLAEFMAALPKLDADFAAYLNASGGVPRYMAEINRDSGSVSLRMVGEKLSAQLRGTLNQVTFTTERYADLPLTIIGPGAGLQVTAGAVLQDCLYLATSAG